MCIQYDSSSLTSNLYSEATVDGGIRNAGPSPCCYVVYHLGFILQEVQMALPDQQDTSTQE